MELKSEFYAIDQVVAIVVCDDIVGGSPSGCLCVNTNNEMLIHDAEFDTVPGWLYTGVVVEINKKLLKYMGDKVINGKEAKSRGLIMS